MVEFIGWMVLVIVGLAGYSWLGCFFVDIMVRSFPDIKEINADGTPKQDLLTYPFDYFLIFICLSIWPIFLGVVLIEEGTPKLCKWVASWKFWGKIDFSWFFGSAFLCAEKLCNYFSPKQIEKKEGE